MRSVLEIFGGHFRGWPPSGGDRLEEMTRTEERGERWKRKKKKRRRRRAARAQGGNDGRREERTGQEDDGGKERRAKGSRERLARHFSLDRRAATV